jgi:hypothetical protein
LKSKNNKGNAALSNREKNIKNEKIVYISDAIKDKNNILDTTSN